MISDWALTNDDELSGLKSSRLEKAELVKRLSSRPLPAKSFNAEM
jgi:hypothetical protein